MQPNTESEKVYNKENVICVKCSFGIEFRDLCGIYKKWIHEKCLEEVILKYPDGKERFKNLMYPAESSGI